MLKAAFIAIHDYQSGSVVSRIFARNLSEVEHLLPRPNWVVYSESDPNRPRLSDESRILESDIDDRAPWLQQMVEIERMSNAGKHQFPVRGIRSGKFETRLLWARNINEIQTTYPGLQVLMGVGIPVETLKVMEVSDIDQPDEFLSHFTR